MAELVLTNGRIHTMDAADRVVSAIGICDGLVDWAGDDGRVTVAAARGVQVLDLDGRTVIPGLIDAHNHFNRSALRPAGVDCSTPPFDRLCDVLAVLSDHARRALPGQWVRGEGFHWSRVHERRNPTIAELDASAPDNPLILMDASYHACFVNSRALEVAGIDRHSPPGRSGVLVVDKNGDPTGALLESTVNRPEEISWLGQVSGGRDEAIGLLEAHARRLLALGITRVGDALVTPASSALYRDASAADRLPIAVDQLLGGPGFFEPPRPVELGAPAVPTSAPAGRLTAGTVKLFMDVVHPSPAIDQLVGERRDAHTGATFYGRGEAIDLACDLAARGFGIAIHALGNCAIDRALDAFAAVRATTDGTRARLRIEHFILGNEAQARRTAELGIQVVTNPGFADTWGDQYLERWVTPGRPDLHVLPIRTLLDAGVAVSAASDHPCDSANPFHGMWAAVARRSWTGDLLFPDEAVSRQEAVRMFTRTAADAAGVGDEEGSLEVGRRANLVVVDRDPLACDLDALPDTVVLASMVGGQVTVYSDGMDAGERDTWALVPGRQRR